LPLKSWRQLELSSERVRLGIVSRTAAAVQSSRNLGRIAAPPFAEDIVQDWRRPEQKSLESELWSAVVCYRFCGAGHDVADKIVKDFRTRGCKSGGKTAALQK
jgi:hypothetical protein